MSKRNDIIPADSWLPLQQFTAARIAQGRAGVSLPTAASLRFSMDHAMARDAIYTPMDTTLLMQGLNEAGMDFICLHSRAADRKEYLLRPDKGRQLSETAAAELQSCSTAAGVDLCITVADGLSPMAVNKQVQPLLQVLSPLLKKEKYTVSPVCIVNQGRVAVSDETGFILKAKVSLILIGERPGLSSPDSLGAYLTYDPLPGNTDEKRNCISNIREEGLRPAAAAGQLLYLLQEAMRIRGSGVLLKDNRDLLAGGES